MLIQRYGIFFVQIGVILFLILPLTACSRNAPEGGQGKPEGRTLMIPVQLGRVVFKDVVDEIRTVGNVMAEHRVNINAEVAGQIVEFPVKEGTRVRAGDLIARIDPREYRLEVERLQADLISARKDYEKSREGVRPEEKERLQARVKADESVLELARKEERRFHRLLREGVISQSQYDEAVDRLRRAEEGLRASKAQLAAGWKAREEDIIKNQAALESVTKRLELAQLHLEKTSILAPFDGIIVSRAVEVGGYVKGGDAVAEMIGASALKAVVEVPQKYRDRLKQLREIVLSFTELGRTRTLKQRLAQRVRVIPDADIISGNIQTQIDLDEVDRDLFPGLTLEARLRFATRRGVKHVPSISLVIGEQGTVVYVAKEGRAHLVPVKAGLERDGLVEVEDFTHQLKRDSQLILRGSGAVFPGARILATVPGPGERPGRGARQAGKRPPGPPGRSRPPAGLQKPKAGGPPAKPPAGEKTPQAS